MEVKDLSYSYAGSNVLEDICFSVGKGEILGILGPNGGGKTTLLKNLNKNLSPKCGCVLVDGTDIAGLTKKAIASKVAVVPQTNEVNFSFTVREIVEMGRMPFQESFRGNSTSDTEIVDRALEQTGLTNMQDRLINTMSGGERQRVIIARAIAQTPQILLMDEPTLHLDISKQFDSLNLVTKLARENGMTVVIVSHDLAMAARYCDRIIMIHGHRIHAVGKPEEVLTPENMRTVFNVDADLFFDEKTGKNTVILHDSYNGN